MDFIHTIEDHSQGEDHTGDVRVVVTAFEPADPEINVKADACFEVYDLETGQEWPEELSKAMLEEIRSRAIKKMEREPERRRQERKIELAEEGLL